MVVRVGIIDYGVGNLFSIASAFTFLAAEATLVRDQETASKCSHLLLPGVGSYAYAMEQIRLRGFDELVLGAASEGKPILGICLGFQLLFASSEEDGTSVGLALFPGEFEKFSEGSIRVPHVGFSSVDTTSSQRLFSGLPALADFYFSHSYRMVSRPDGASLGYADYGGRFVASIEAGNVMGTQFHPEKSQSNGLRVLQNFIGIS